nr:BC1881 family protein [Secundilactobacillus oryzae]
MKQLELNQVSTKDLSDELRSRVGIQSIILDPYEKSKITVGNKEVFNFDGPAVILVNID